MEEIKLSFHHWFCPFWTEEYHPNKSYQQVTKTLPQTGGGIALLLRSLFIGADFISVPEAKFPSLESELNRTLYIADSEKKSQVKQK